MEALRQLDPRHREVLVELFYRGHSVAEAAARLRVSPDVVKVRTYYALRRLRLLLEEGGTTAMAGVRADVSALDGGDA